MLRTALHRLAPSTATWTSPCSRLPVLALQPSLQSKRWATKKAGGTVKNTSDSKPKYLGVKKFGGEWCKPGNIIIRQRGQKYKPGDYVGMGRDFTIWALVEGQVKFKKRYLRSAWTKKIRERTFVGIEPGKKPEKKRRSRPVFAEFLRRRQRRREREAARKPFKEQSRLFQYKLPKTEVLASVEQR